MAVQATSSETHQADITLFDIKSSPNREQFLGSATSKVIKEKFGSIEHFFQCLDEAQDDTLKAYKFKILSNNTSKLGTLKTFLSSPLGRLSDEELLNYDVYELNHCVCIYIKGIKKRLKHIEKHKQELLQPTDEEPSLPTKWFGINCRPQTLTLRQFRNLKSNDELDQAYVRWEGIFYNLFGIATKANLSFLSLEQKKLVTDQELFKSLLRSDSMSQKRKYMTEMEQDIVEKLIERTSTRDQHLIPLEVFTKLNLAVLSDVKFRASIYNRLDQLHTFGLDESLLKKIVNRLVRLACKREDLVLNPEFADPTEKSVPFIPPDMLDKLSDEAMKLVDFEDLSDEALLVLFCTHTRDNWEKLGFIFEEGNEGTCYLSGADYQSSSFANSDPKHLTPFHKVYPLFMGGHKKDVKERKKTLEHRFGLMSPEQYSAIRERLDPEAREIGDSVHLQQNVP